MGTDMSRIEWHNQFDLWWPWKCQINKRNLRYGISLKWWDLHYTLFVSIEEYYELAYCVSREGMRTLAFSHFGSRNSRKQQYLPILRAKAFKSCFFLISLFLNFQIFPETFRKLCCGNFPSSRKLSWKLPETAWKFATLLIYKLCYRYHAPGYATIGKLSDHVWWFCLHFGVNFWLHQ